MQAALSEAEAVLQRLVDALVTVTEVPAGPPSVMAEPPGTAVPGSMVPRRETGMAATALAPDYQRILAVLESEAGREGMRCQQLALALGLEVIPAKVEGLRSRRNAWRNEGGHSRCGQEYSSLPRCRPSDAGRPASGQATDHEHGHRPQHHGLVHGRQRLVAAHQATRAHQPAQGALTTHLRGSTTNPVTSSGRLTI
ncbi:hypothetical protein ACYF6T_37960 [Streptomyces sp. 7R007]